MSTCRLCKEWGNLSEMVQYGRRHYAHHECFLSKGKDLKSLRDWQVVNFPATLLIKYGMTSVADAAYGRLYPSVR